MKKNYIAVVSNDAGGAEILSSYIKKKKNNYIFVLTGPAKKIFYNKLKKIKNVNLEKAEKISHKLICGTSFQSKLELKAISKFIKNGKETTALLDHWTNYKKRFIYKKKFVQPQNIWVFDHHAKKLAKKIFNRSKIFLKQNYFLSDIKKSYHKKKKLKKKYLNILYASEPISEFKKKYHSNLKNLFEYKTFKYFYNNINYITKKNYKIRFRHHPNENHKKYRWVFRLFKNIKLSKNISLIKDIERSDVVVGRQTMALVVGLVLGKKVISCIPPDEKRCIIPFNAIKEMRDLVH